MKTLLASALMAAVAVAGPALALGDNPLSSGPKPAIKSDNAAPPASPVPGRTSFTSDEARDWMTKRGYTLTSNPLKDENGLWYAEGSKNGGQPVMVMMDYQGNVYEGSEYSGHPNSAPGVTPTQPEPVKPVNPKQR